MKIYLEIEVPDGTAPKGISERWIPENIRVAVETHLTLHNYPEVAVTLAEDPGEAHNRGYDEGFNGGMSTCEAQHD